MISDSLLIAFCLMALAVLLMAIRNNFGSGGKSRRIRENDVARQAGLAGERRVIKAFRNAGVPALHNVFLLHASGTLAQADIIANLGNHFLVCEVKNWRGAIEDAPVVSEKWVVKTPDGRFRCYPNPLNQARKQAAALENEYPAVPVRYIAVMAGSARFVDGVPEGVVMLSDLENILKEQPYRRNAGVSRIWARLMAADARANKTKLSARHLAQLRSRHG